MTATGSTDWLRVWLLFLACSSTSIHMGKIPIGLPEITDDLGLTLFESSWIVALFSILIATLGLVAGLLAGRRPYHHAMIAGLIITGIASLSGSHADFLEGLLLTRVFEGLGWLLVAVSTPVLMTARGTARDRPLILGLFGAFVPAGMVIILLLSSLIVEDYGWKGLWQLSGILSLIAAVVVTLVCRDGVQTHQHNLELRTVGHVVLRAAPWFMFSIFFIYSASYAIGTAYFPTLLLDLELASLQLAGTLAAVGIVGNVLGNVSAGWLLRHGWSSARTLTTGLIGLGVMALLIFSDTTGLSLKALGLFLFCFTGGMIPGTLFATAPLVVSNPAYVGIINGLILQAAGVGQLAGPPILSGLVEWSGRWVTGGIAELVVCLFSCIFVYALHRTLKPET